jgi:hypothetical protein
MQAKLIIYLLVATTSVSWALGENPSLLNKRSLSGAMNNAKFLLCAGTDINSCQFKKLKESFDQMNAANCKFCDKYFHCKGNYDAVYGCSGSIDTKRATAKKLSDCREKAQNSNPSDSRLDQIANADGRKGVNCATKYLCKSSCAWSPSRRTCSRSNCPNGYGG